MNKIQRAALYIRVSTSEQAMHGYSLQAQRDFLTRYATEHSMVPVGVYADEGKTARKDLRRRKAIRTLLDDVSAGKIDVILFWKMDRWFRSVSDFYKVQEILDQNGVKWIAVAEPSVNLDTREGRLNLNIMLSIGQNEVDTTSERIKFTRKSMVENGRAIYGDRSLPFGYKLSEVDGFKRVVKDPSVSHIVDDLLRYYSLYRNKMRTVRYVRDTYGIHFTESMFGCMLESNLFCGSYMSNDRYCEPYMSAEDWGNIRHIVGSKIPSGGIYLFSSLIRCPVCGCSMGGNYSCKRGNPDVRYQSYRCNKCRSVRISESFLERYLLDNLSKEVDKYIVFKSDIAAQKKSQKKKRSSEQIRKEIDRLNMLFQKGRIGFEYYDGEYERLNLEMSEVSSAPEPEPDYSALRSLDGFQDMYMELDASGKKAFWHSIIKEVHINTEKKVTFVDFL